MTSWSTRRSLIFVWAFFTTPIALSALLLLCVSITIEGRLFALALISATLAPTLSEFGPKKIPIRVFLITAVLLLFICYLRSPATDTTQSGRAKLTFAGETRNNRFSPASLVPEADQQILGTYLFGTIDPYMGWAKAKSLRTDVIRIYSEFLADEELHHLPSTMGFAYSDLFFGKRPVGNFFTYVPESPGPAPIPVVLFLHGSLGNFQAYWVLLKELADKANVAVIAPTFGAGNWYLDGGMDSIGQAIDYCREHPKMDTSRMHLAGLSNGGTGVTRAVARFPGAFQSVILISPVLESQIIRSPEFQKNMRDRSVLLIAGEADKRIPVKSIQNSANLLDSLMITVDTCYFENGDHFIFFSERKAIIAILTEWLAP